MDYGWAAVDSAFVDALVAVKPGVTRPFVGLAFPPSTFRTVRFPIPLRIVETT